MHPTITGIRPQPPPIYALLVVAHYWPIRAIYTAITDSPMLDSYSLKRYMNRTQKHYSLIQHIWVQIQQTARDVFQVLVRTSRVHHATFCYTPAALPVQHHFLADDMQAIQEGEWDRGRGKVEEGEKRKGDEGIIGRGGEKGDKGGEV